MNSLIENNYIKEMTCGSNFSYILNDNCTFLSTEYKVLQNQVDGCFVQCMKMLYNGKIQLFFLTSKYKSLAALLPTLDTAAFMTISSHLLANIIDVKNNGFLSSQNIDISLEHIYIDSSNYKVVLIYLPIRQRMFEDDASFENELRTTLVKLIHSYPALSNAKTQQFAANLSNGSMDFNSLYMSVKTHKVLNPINSNENNKTSNKLKIIAMNSTRLEIDITKDEFILGKKQGAVDGVISFNKMISRSHCKINRQGSQFTVTDLHSANGTYVNHMKLQPDNPCLIKNGDIIRMANSDFQVVIYEENRP